MMNTADIVYFLKNVDCVTSHITRNNNIHFMPVGEHRNNTVEFALFHDCEGFYFRRVISGLFYSANPYQLFRNNPYEWTHFATIEEAVECFQKYLTNINKRMNF